MRMAGEITKIIIYSLLEKVQKLYDRYVEEGGDQMKLYTNVIMGIMAVSGFFTAEQAEAMEDKLEAATQQML